MRSSIQRGTTKGETEIIHTALERCYTRYRAVGHSYLFEDIAWAPTIEDSHRMADAVGCRKLRLQ